MRDISAKFTAHTMTMWQLLFGSKDTGKEPFIYFSIITKFIFMASNKNQYNLIIHNSTTKETSTSKYILSPLSFFLLFNSISNKKDQSQRQHTHTSFHNPSLSTHTQRRRRGKNKEEEPWIWDIRMISLLLHECLREDIVRIGSKGEAQLGATRWFLKGNHENPYL